jgi:hypothetical protein
MKTVFLFLLFRVVNNRMASGSNVWTYSKRREFARNVFFDEKIERNDASPNTISRPV